MVGVPIGMIGNRLSRAVERRADEYSLELAGASDAFISFERAIALQNVAELAPPRWVTALMASHPPTDERIGAAVAFAQPPPGSRGSRSGCSDAYEAQLIGVSRSTAAGPR